MQIRKILSFLAAALIMITAASCRKEDEQLPEDTKLPLPETSRITRINENAPRGYDFFAVYSDRPRPTEQQAAEIVDSLGKIFDACGFLYGFFPESSDYCYNYADFENTVDTTLVWGAEYRYYAVNTDYAADEEELVENIRSALSENFIDDDELYSELFKGSGADNIPKYKTIGGTLCMEPYIGTKPMPENYENIKILCCDGSTAEAIIFANDEDGENYYISLECSGKYGWRASRIERCDLESADIFYDLLYVKTGIINMILGGGTTPPDPREITVNGKKFAETDIMMSISDMKEIFDDTFLYDNYSKQYIDDVYYEENGIIYRDKNADKYYIPEIIIDPCDMGRNRTFCDRYSGKTEELHIELNADENGNYTIYYGLPVKKQFSVINAGTDIPYEENIPADEIDENTKRINEMLYNAVYLKTGELNEILGGVPAENAAEITVNGEKYTENNVISIKEMTDLFNETFAKESFKTAEPFTGVTIGSDLRDELIEKYITDVYYEQDGVVYRRDTAPEYYLPEMIFSADTVNKVTDQRGAADVDMNNSYFAAEVMFRDREGNIISSDVSVYYSMADDPGSRYEFIYIASELPLIAID